MKVRLTYFAELELDEAIEYYNFQVPGLGSKFYEEVEQAIERIVLLPKAWTKIGKYTRRCLIKTFPYMILYTIENNFTIVITAIANTHRNPEHYQDMIR